MIDCQEPPGLGSSLNVSKSSQDLKQHPDRRPDHELECVHMNGDLLRVLT